MDDVSLELDNIKNLITNLTNKITLLQEKTKLNTSLISIKDNNSHDITLSEEITNFNEILIVSHFGGSSIYGAEIRLYTDTILEGDTKYSFTQSSTYNYSYTIKSKSSDMRVLNIARGTNGWSSDTGSELNVYGIGRK